MPAAPYRNEDEARAAVEKSLRESGFNPVRFDITPLHTCSAHNDQLEDVVDLRFPINEEGSTTHKMTGTYELIITVIGESKTFDELVANGRKRKLKVVSKTL